MLRSKVNSMAHTFSGAEPEDELHHILLGSVQVLYTWYSLSNYIHDVHDVMKMAELGPRAL